MSLLPNALCLSASPVLERFNRPLLKHLSQHISIAQWEYLQTPDEPMSLEIALGLLNDYLQDCDRPLHLIGHSTGGLLGLLYARHYPEKVRSLTLLSVGVHPAFDWQAYYYTQVEKLSCPREKILTQMVYNFFGYQSRPVSRELLQVLEKDLMSSLSPHTLYQPVHIPSGGVSVPLLVCGSQDDAVIDSNALQGWQPWLKKGDRIWQCPQGRYFFHYFKPQQVGEQVTNFWKCLSLSPNNSRILDRDIKVSQ